MQVSERWLQLRSLAYDLPLAPCFCHDPQTASQGNFRQTMVVAQKCVKVSGGTGFFIFATTNDSAKPPRGTDCTDDLIVRLILKQGQLGER
jgi:hypothetical protein